MLLQLIKQRDLLHMVQIWILVQISRLNIIWGSQDRPFSLYRSWSRVIKNCFAFLFIHKVWLIKYKALGLTYTYLSIFPVFIPLQLLASFSPSQRSSCCLHHCCRPPPPTHGSCWFLCPEPWGLLSEARSVCLCWTDCCCFLYACIYKPKHTTRDIKTKGIWDSPKYFHKNTHFSKNV